jgi:Protein of unknown function (DUF1523)
MKWLKRILVGLLIILVGGFLHYYLPSRDVVQIVGTEVKRMDVGRTPWFWDKADAGTQENSTRDVRFINAVWPNGKPRVYRNEDTGWSFPPYFKFDSSNLTAEAQGLAKQDGEVWVAVSHYGWRIEILTMFPNAYKVKRVSSPDALLIPWFNIVFLSLLAFILINIWLAMRRFKKKRIDPVAEKISDIAEDASDEISKGGNKISKLFRRLFGTTK